MTALELADKLSQFGEGAVFANVKLIDVATMLRQQQSEIEALKNARCVACGWNPNLIGGEK